MLLETIFLNFFQYGRDGGGKTFKKHITNEVNFCCMVTCVSPLAVYSFKEIMDKGPIFFFLCSFIVRILSILRILIPGDLL